MNTLMDMDSEKKRSGLFKQGFSWNRLRGTLLLWFLGISLIPLAVVVIITSHSTYKTLKNNAQDKLLLTGEFKANQIQAHFQNCITELLLQSRRRLAREMAEDLKKAFVASGLEVSRFVKSQGWKSLSERYKKNCEYLLSSNGYDDLLVIDPDGNILYTVRERNDLGLNIFSGKYAATNFGKACAKALRDGGPAYSDLEGYAPLGDEPSRFMVAPVYDEKGGKPGLIALRLNNMKVDHIMQETEGLGKRAETYLIGTDLKMRSNSALENAPTILKKPITTMAAILWQEEQQEKRPPHTERSVDIYLGPRGIPVLGLRKSIQVCGVPMAVLAEIETSEAFGAVREQQYIALALFISTMFFVSVLAFLIAKRIAGPITRLSAWGQRVAAGDLSFEEVTSSNYEIRQLNSSFAALVNSFQSVTDIAQAIALGDFNRSIQIRGEKDSFGKAINQMAENLQTVVRQADAISGGDYTVEMHPRSKKDALGSALSRMVNTLREVTAERERQDWLKTGQTLLNEKMRGDQNISSLAQNVINFLSHYLNAQIGAMYLAAPDRTLKFVAGYACTHNLGSFQRNFGEGLIGQAAAEKKTILTTKVPPEYIRITSGLGEASPHNILIVPFLFDEELKGILELGSFSEFSPTHLELLQHVSEGVAIAMHSAENRSRTRDLLEKTQSQTEELICQQEELRQTNEELEEQTRLLEQQKEDVQRKNADLEKAQKMIEEKVRDLDAASRYKSEFLANMSHELRTPLNSILLLSKILSENKDGNLSSKQVEFAKVVHSSGFDLLALINEVLDLSKMEAGKMKVHLDELNLASFARRIEREFQPAAQEKGLALKIDMASRLPESIRTDEQKLSQIIKNLLSNAFKFTSRGEITLTISRPDNRTILPGLGFAPDRSIGISVSDTGEGIPIDKQRLIFEAFQQADGTTSRKYGGTGLGLTISKNLAKLLGGEIHLKSEEGKGSVFTLYLPEFPGDTDSKMHPPANDSRGTDSTELSEADKKRGQLSTEPERIEDDREGLSPAEKSVLIIEDDLNFVRILRDLSREKGFKALVAGEGEAGLHLAEHYKPSAIILDIGLPGMDGWAVMTRLKDNSQTRHIPVHFISAADKRLEAMQMGALDYLTKPVSAERLEEVFERIERTVLKKVKDLLIIGDYVQEEAVLELISDNDVSITAVSSGKEAYSLLQSKIFDCVIMDLALSDMSGLKLLTKIRNDENIHHTPIIVYTGGKLSKQEEVAIKEFSQQIVIKEAKSPERLLEETTLFLHRVESDLPEEKQKILRMIHDKESILKNKKILLVDDDMRNLYALTSILEDRGMKVLVGINGREGLERLEANPDTDLILMDIMMPEMNGYEAIAAVRTQERFRKLPIIALTAKAMRGDRHKCIAAGANDYLAKPVDSERLLTMLRIWLYQ